MNECRDKIAGSKNLIQIGFNRRFDKSHASLKQAYVNGEIGKLEKLLLLVGIHLRQDLII